VRFSRKRGRGVEVRVDPVEAHVLSSVLTDLLELLGEGEQEEADPLAAMVGLTSGAVAPPEDPALARLLPAAYGDDDKAAAEFRRYTEGDLRAGKRANATTLLATLARVGDRGGRLLLDRDEADAWLGALNDVRLVLGVRLEVTEETYLDVPGDDPRSQALHVYGWLGWMQESLLGCLDPRAPR
jgi:hypothetical protein